MKREETEIEIQKGLIDKGIDVRLTTSKFVENHFSRGALREKKLPTRLEFHYADEVRNVVLEKLRTFYFRYS